MTLTSTFIHLYSSFVLNVYKNKFLGLSENFALVNLIFLGCGYGTLYGNVFDGSKSVIAQISIAFAFGQFVATVTFHIWSALKAKCLKKTDSNLTGSQGNVDLDDPWTRSSDYLHKRHDSWRGSFTFNQLRESLLQDSL